MPSPLSSWRSSSARPSDFRYCGTYQDNGLRKGVRWLIDWWMFWLIDGCSDWLMDVLIDWWIYWLSNGKIGLYWRVGLFINRSGTTEPEQRAQKDGYSNWLVDGFFWVINGQAFCIYLFKKLCTFGIIHRLPLTCLDQEGSGPASLLSQTVRQIIARWASSLYFFKS